MACKNNGSRRSENFSETCRRKRHYLKEVEDAADGGNSVLRKRIHVGKVLRQTPDASRKGITDQRLKTNIQQARIFRFSSPVFCFFFSYQLLANTSMRQDNTENAAYLLSVGKSEGGILQPHPSHGTD